MTTIKEEAQAHEQKASIKNVADLSEVSTDVELKNEKGKNSETGEEFEYKFIEINGEKYRVPNKVIGDLKVILGENKDLKKFKVRKTGIGLETRYTVIPLG
jgi:hypothetical protein